MHTARLHVPSLAEKCRWPVVITISVFTGVFPFTAVSNAVEFCAIVALPFYLGFLISRWWDARSIQLTLAFVLPLFGSVVRLATTSLHDGSNWFTRLFRVISFAFTDPYVRQIFLVLVFPVFVTIVSAVMFMSFRKRDHAKDA